MFPSGELYKMMSDEWFLFSAMLMLYDIFGDGFHYW